MATIVDKNGISCDKKDATEKRGKFSHYEAYAWTGGVSKYDKNPWGYDFPNCKEGDELFSTTGMDQCSGGSSWSAHVHRWIYDVEKVDNICQIKLESETVAKLPKNRKRTIIGVGEAVVITSNVPVTWEINSNLITTTGQDTQIITITAQDKVGSVTIKAKNESDEKSITFTIFAPEDVEYFNEKVIHRKGNVSLGFKANVYLLPKNVNFDVVRISELEQKSIGTGYWEYLNGQKHCSYETDIEPGKPCGWVNSVHNGKGNVLHQDGKTSEDIIWVAEKNQGCPLGNGTFTIEIPIQ